MTIRCMNVYVISFHHFAETVIVIAVHPLRLTLVRRPCLVRGSPRGYLCLVLVVPAGLRRR